MNAGPSRNGWIGVVAGGLAVIALQVWGVRGQSLTSDEPYHLLAGDRALRHGENTLNLEHPPLVKMVAALPLLLEREPLTEKVDVTRWRDASKAIFRDPALTRRLQHRARALLVAAFALPWLAGCYRLGRRIGGPRAGALLALALGLSFSVLAYLPIVTTDAAVALGYVATLLAAGRYLERPRPGEAALLGAGLGLAVAAKYSGLFVAPAVILALAMAPAEGQAEAAGGEPEQGTWRRSRSHRLLRFLSHGTAATAVAVVVVGATYALANRGYDPGRGREAIRLYAENRATLLVDGELRPWEGRLLAVERRSPGLAQWLTGLLGIRAQNAIGVYPAYAFGRIERHGRWWYFPLVLLIKTPLPLLAATLAAALAALAASRRRPGAPGIAPRPRPEEGRDGGEGSGRERQPRSSMPAGDVRRRFAWVLAATALIYLLAAATSSYNLGYRHLLPILPILLLPAALWAARRAWTAAALALLLAAESMALGPHWIASTNTWWLGARNPTRFALAGDNFDWKQGLVELADDARSRHLDGPGDLRVLDPLLSPTELGAYLPQARLLSPGDPIEPGWYAVAILLDQYLPAILTAGPEQVYAHERYLAIARTWEPTYQEIRRRGHEDGLAAGTFRIYQVGP